MKKLTFRKITRKRKIIYGSLLIGIVFIGFLVWFGIKTVKTIENFVIEANQETQEREDSFKPETYFKDLKVIELCRAAKAGDTVKVNQLIKDGVDVNSRGNRGMTPLIWLMYKVKQSPEKIKGFKALVNNGADPLMIYKSYSRGDWAVLDEAAGHYDPVYLKAILDAGVVSPEKIDTEINGQTSLEQAELSNNFENFIMLLDYGSNINQVDETGRSILNNTSGNMSWKFAYELLKRGADYEYALAHGMRTGFDGLSYAPSLALIWDGVDYRQKCAQFLRKKGINIKLNMPIMEKYIRENGKDILYINEKYIQNGDPLKRLSEQTAKNKPDHWVKYTESSLYKEVPLNPKTHQPQDPDTQKSQDPETQKYIDFLVERFQKQLAEDKDR